MSKMVLLCVGMLLSNICFAQGIGIEAGGSVSSMRATMNGKSVESGIRVGIRAGVMNDDNLSDKLSFQYGAFYNAKGSGIRYQNTTADNTGATIMQDLTGYVRVDYIELPLAILYHVKEVGKRHLFFGGGPYASLAFGGLLSLDNKTTRIHGTVITKTYKYSLPAFIGSEETDDFTLMDAGVHAQAGYESPKGFYMRMNISYGLTDVNPSSHVVMKNQSIAITAGYIMR